MVIFRPIKGICGFSRETVIAVTTNIESIEFRRRENGTHGFEEHPRAGTTDDVEYEFDLEVCNLEWNIPKMFPNNLHGQSELQSIVTMER